jgi:hypothetical protein
MKFDSLGAQAIAGFRLYKGNYSPGLKKCHLRALLSGTQLFQGDVSQRLLNESIQIIQ